ncbi:MAG: hypothetical protein J0I06_19560 [Planctomycetes bacterium]|nr:hypothetical protein [Planctomycetota bacterium]
MRRPLLALPALALALVTAPSRADEPRSFNVTARRITEVQETRTVTAPATGLAKTVTVARPVPTNVVFAINPAKCAVVVCDMWDDHWCKSAATRCAELAKQAEPALKACRDRGMTIIHCPSDTMPFYKDHPARKRALAVKKAEPPKSKDLPSPALPVDDSDGGCDDAQPAKQFKAWTRQHAAITIDGEKDFVTDSGGEVYGPYGGAGAWSAYNPATGTYAHGSAAWGPNGGTASASFANPRYGVSGSTTQSANAYGHWGSSVVSTPTQTVHTASAIPLCRLPFAPDQSIAAKRVKWSGALAKRRPLRL